MSSLTPAPKAGPVRPLDADDPEGAVQEPTWEVLPSEPRWQVWREESGRRPRTRAEKRGRVAAATVGIIVGVLGIALGVSYGQETQTLHSDAELSLQTGGPLYPIDDPGPDPTTMITKTVETGAQQQVPDEGRIGIVEGVVVAATPNAAAVAADETFVMWVKALSVDSTVTVDTYTSPSTECVYQVIPYLWTDGTGGAIVRIVDLTPDRDRMSRDYLLYGLVGLGIAGAAGGVQYWRLGRGRNDRHEPTHV